MTGEQREHLLFCGKRLVTGKDKDRLMQTRKARLADLDQVTNLAVALQKYHEPFDSGFALRRDAKRGIKSFLKRNLYSKKSLLIVAEENKRIVGYLLAILASRPPIFKQRQYGFVMDAYVSEEHRGKGATKRMLSEAYSWFKKHKVKEVVLTVHTENSLGIRVWEKEGFETVFLRKRKRI
jgi:ribosomal protein S18 acetylase RimI-like enzyme